MSIVNLFKRLALKLSSSIINTFFIFSLLFPFYNRQLYLKGISVGDELRFLFTFQSVALLQVANPNTVRLYALVVIAMGVYAVVLYDEHVFMSAYINLEHVVVMRMVMLYGILNNQLQTKRQYAFVAVTV